MTPGTVLKAESIWFLVLLEHLASKDSWCVPLRNEPWVDSRGVIDTILGTATQWYLLPGTAVLAEGIAEKLLKVDVVDIEIVKNIILTPAILMQLQVAFSNRS